VTRPALADEPRVLGIDPGSRSTGWGLVGGSATEPRVIDRGVFRLGARPALALRLAALHEGLVEVVRRLAPTCAAVETPFEGVNVRSALHLAHARGVILAVLAAEGVEIHEYSPAAVKKAVTGNGRAGKGQVSAMVSRLLDRALPGGTPDDLSDALAVALCHLTVHRFREAVRRSVR